MAFLHLSSAQIMIRINGKVPVAGIHRFPDGTTISAVINMTITGPAAKIINRVPIDTQLKSGDIVSITSTASKTYEVTLSSMTVKERMVLGIPLNPNALLMADWDALPGIGPELAKRIIVDRQYNGDFESVDALKRVPGIGEKKISSLRRLFVQR